LRSGFDGPQHDLANVARDRRREPPVRCGAALRLLLLPISVAERHSLQGLLTSALVSDASYARQDVFNLHLARRLAVEWKVIGEGPFNFTSPRHDLPTLRQTLALVEQGRGTLKTVLTSVHAVLRTPVPEYMDRVW
jgi:hypothetical protein